MGCTNGAVSLDAANFSLITSISEPGLEVDANFKQVLEEYINYCEEVKSLGVRYYQIAIPINRLIIKVFPGSQTGDFSKRILEDYIIFILHVVHNLVKVKNKKNSLNFSNYLPGFIIDDAEDLDGDIKIKFENLVALCNQLNIFIREFDSLSKDMIENVTKLRDYYPKKLYEACKNISGFGCIVPFSRIEQILIENLDRISNAAKNLDRIFDETQYIIGNLLMVIEKCQEKFSDFKKLLNDVDTWDDDYIRSRKLSRFLSDHSINI